METLSRHFRDMTKACFARHGFAYGELLAQWPEVVGADLAPYCEPERLRWPRGGESDGRKLGGTLTVRAAPGRGLELQYESPRILERINGFYGYGAVAAIKIVQKGELASRRKPPVAQPRDAIEGTGLEPALARLGAVVAARRKSNLPAGDSPSLKHQDRS